MTVCFMNTLQCTTSTGKERDDVMFEDRVIRKCQKIDGGAGVSLGD